jgi:Fur family ferric uptake transcriptional regulator
MIEANDKHSINSTAIASALDEAGLRQTRPRRAIAEEIARLAAEDADFTIEDLWRNVRAHSPHIGRATAFRTVEILVELGILDRITFANGSERYHSAHGESHHHHLTCESCHKVVEFVTCLPSSLLDQVAREAGFTLLGHRIDLYGRCPQCQVATGK